MAPSVPPEEIDTRNMDLALRLAWRGVGRTGSNPSVGAVIVAPDTGEIIARGTTAEGGRPHAETIALDRAGARARGATLYVTLEPCVMRAGAIVNARIQRVVFGARDLRFGGVRSKFRLADSELLNHRVEVVEGVCGAEAQETMKRFFETRRG